MNFNTYEDYIDSNIEWFSSVPKHWNLIKIKHLINYYTNGAWGKEKQNDINDIICIRIADFNYPQRNVKDIDFTIRNIPLNNKLLLKPGDLLIEKSGGGEKQPVGRVVLFDKDIKATFSNFISKLKIKSEYNSNYLCYVFNMLYSSRVNTKSIKQTTGIQNLDSYAYFDEIIAIPQINEQKQIASYLNKKTSEIDETISKNKRLIRLLEEKSVTLINDVVTKGLNPDVQMKDSNVEWIGKIPKHWELIKNKHIFKKSKVIVGPNWDKYDVLSLTKNGVIIKDIERNEGKMPSDFSIYQIVNPGNLLMCLFDIDVTPRCVGYIENKGIVSAAYTELSAIDNINIKYYYWWYLMLDIDKRLLHLSKNLRNSLSTEDFMALTVVKPPLEEQKQIDEFLTNEISKINDAITKIEDNINLLEEYKTSLIHNVVTGKIDVRGEMI